MRSTPASSIIRHIAARGLIATALGAAVSLASVVGTPASAAADAPAVSRLIVPVAATVYDPCTLEAVGFAGALNFEALATVVGDGEIELRFMVQATDVVGVGLSSGAPYRLVGEAHGVSTGSLERAVSAADFGLIATPSPGVDIGHAEAKPSTTIVFRLTLSEDGLVERASAESACTEQRCA